MNLNELLEEYFGLGGFVSDASTATANPLEVPEGTRMASMSLRAISSEDASMASMTITLEDDQGFQSETTVETQVTGSQPTTSITATGTIDETISSNVQAYVETVGTGDTVVDGQSTVTQDGQLLLQTTTNAAATGNNPAASQTLATTVEANEADEQIVIKIEASSQGTVQDSPDADASAETIVIPSLLVDVVEEDPEMTESIEEGIIVAQASNAITVEVTQFDSSIELAPNIQDVDISASSVELW